MSNELPEQLIIFSLDGNLFGLNVTIVQEILPTVPLRILPKTADHLQGLIDFRGQIMPLINLRSLLGLSADRSVQTVIVVQVNGRSYGLMVDGVKEVLNVDGQLLPGSQATGIVPADFISGVIQAQETDVIVLRETALIESLQFKGGMN